jgi:hypothetical protein
MRRCNVSKRATTRNAELLILFGTKYLRTTGHANSMFSCSSGFTIGWNRQAAGALRPDLRGECGVSYFVWRGRHLRRLNAEMSGFEGERIELKTVDGEQAGYEGIFLRKIGPWYVAPAAEWNGGTNREDGACDIMYSVSKSLTGPLHAASPRSAPRRPQHAGPGPGGPLASGILRQRRNRPVSRHARHREARYPRYGRRPAHWTCAGWAALTRAGSMYNSAGGRNAAKRKATQGVS